MNDVPASSTFHRELDVWARRVCSIVQLQRLQFQDDVTGQVSYLEAFALERGKPSHYKIKYQSVQPRSNTVFFFFFLKLWFVREVEQASSEP